MAEETTETVKANKIEFGTTELTAHIAEQTGQEFSGAKLRVLLRKLVKDEVLQPFEGRYSFTGPKDPRVTKIVKAVKDGEAEKADQDRKDELKAKRKPAPKKTKAKKAEAPVVVEDEVDDDDLEEL